MNPNETKDFDLRQEDSVVYQRSHPGPTNVSTFIGRTSRNLKFLLLLISASLLAQERTIDPTWLHRYLPASPEMKVDLASPNCHYKPMFGVGDKDDRILRSVSRFGEV